MDIYNAVFDGNLQRVMRLIQGDPTIINQRDELQELTPLHYAAWGNHKEVVSFLLDHGADINHHDNYKHATPVLYACEYGLVEMVGYLLSRGGDLTISGEKGITPLMIACTNGHAGVVSYLLTHSPDVRKSINIQDHHGSTALMGVCVGLRGEYMEVMMRLMRAGADPTVGGERTAMDWLRLLAVDSIGRVKAEACIRYMEVSE